MSVRFAVFVVCGLVSAIAKPVHAQQMSYDQWAGPPLEQENNLDVTWSGQTQYGYTVYLKDRTSGGTAVLWQATPSSNWQFKAANGNTATLTPDMSSVVSTHVVTGTPQPQQRLLPQRYAPQPYSAPQGGYSTAGYQDRAYTQQQQAAAAFTMFGMVLCAASGRC